MNPSSPVTVSYSPSAFETDYIVPCIPGMVNNKLLSIMIPVPMTSHNEEYASYRIQKECRTSSNVTLIICLMLYPVYRVLLIVLYYTIIIKQFICCYFYIISVISSYSVNLRKIFECMIMNHCGLRSPRKVFLRIVWSMSMAYPRERLIRSSITEM